MNVNYHKIFSHQLGHEFEFKAYGHAGKPIMVFPCSQGRFYDYENFGMFDVLRGHIDAGNIRVFTVDSRDWENWYSRNRTPAMGVRYRKYEDCLNYEVVPFIMKQYGFSERFLTTGHSWGAYHALNFALKHPGIYDSTICLSGSYSLRHVLGDYYDPSVQDNDIPRYLPQLNDPARLKQLAQGYMIICHGRGAWEVCNDEAAAVAGMLSEKGITCWYDVWGENYPHDWPSWKEQIVKFLGALQEGVMFPQAADGILRLVGPQRRILPIRNRFHSGKTTVTRV